MKETPRESRLVEGQSIEGVALWSLTPHRDSRGTFTEVFLNDWESGLNPVQWSVVASNPRVLRGMHLHWEHDEYVMVVKGHASVGLRDVRPDSPTRGAWSLYGLFAEDPAALIFPRGLLHGWYFHEPSLHLQAVSEAYHDYHPRDNVGVHWSDPDLEIPWPDSDPVVSDRAEGFTLLKDLAVPVYVGEAT